MTEKSLLNKLKRNQLIINGLNSAYSIGFNIWVTLIAPFIIGYYVTLYYSSITTNDPSAGLSYFLHTHGISIVVVFIIHILVSIWTFYQARMYHTAHEFEALENRLKKVELDKRSIISRMTFIDYSVVIMDIFTDLLKNNPNIKKQDIYESLISYLNQFRQELFNFSGQALYNFAIYEFNYESKKLEIAYRIHDDRLDTKGRSWGIGMGHVGMSFAQRRSMICNDAAESSELSMSDSDLVNYSSFISTPIGKPLSSDNEPDPYGVLVITSSEPNQFIANLHDDFLRNLCDIMSIKLTSILEASDEKEA